MFAAANVARMHSAARYSVTKARDWPNAAAWARDDAAAELIRAYRALDPLVSGETFDRTETLRRLAIAMTAVQQALLYLERVGAKTRNIG